MKRNESEINTADTNYAADNFITMMTAAICSVPFPAAHGCQLSKAIHWVPSLLYLAISNASQEWVTSAFSDLTPQLWQPGCSLAAANYSTQLSPFCNEFPEQYVGVKYIAMQLIFRCLGRDSNIPGNNIMIILCFHAMQDKQNCSRDRITKTKQNETKKHQLQPCCMLYGQFSYEKEGEILQEQSVLY